MSSVEDEPPHAKRRRTDDEVELIEVKEPEVVVPDEDVWFEPKHMATIVVHVDICNVEGKVYRIMHMHCIPGALVINSVWFNAILESDRDVKEITMPRSFSYVRLWNGQYGTTRPEVNDVKEFFGMLHLTVKTFTNTVQIMRLINMAHYIQCDRLLEIGNTHIMSVINQVLPDTLWMNLAYANYYNNQPVIRSIKSALSSGKLMQADKTNPSLLYLDKAVLIELIALGR